MASVRRGTVLRQIERLFGAGTSAGLADAQLLERFLDRRDETAFATLVERHGQMVLGTCRSVLRDPHDAEDAFQAVFLVLFRKAGSIRGKASIGGWLHRVAIRIAVQSNGAAARRRVEERGAGALRRSSTMPDAACAGDELRCVLDAEIDRLPERYRLPVVLCHLEGLTRAEAAQRLRWSEGTVRSRLAKARQILQSRLTRRGVVCPAGLLGAALAREASAAVPEGWINATVEAASGLSAGRATATILADRLLKAIFAAKMKLLAATVLTAGSIVCLAAVLVAGVAGRDVELPPPGASPPTVRPMPGAGPIPVGAAEENEGTIAFAGRVVDPAGKPYAGAALYLVHPSSEGGEANPQAKAISGPDGRFRFTVTKAEVDQADGKHRRDESQVVAVAGGFGPDWHRAARAGVDDLEMRLVKDVPIEGHVLDLEGRPVAGARVNVEEVATVKGGDLTTYIATVADDTEDGNGRLLDNRWEGRFPGQPGSVRTDAGGRFRMAGFGGERLVELGVEGTAIESVTILAMTRAAKDVGGPGEKALGKGSGRLHGAAFDLLVRPGRVITGVVRDKVTRRPIARMRVRSFDTSAHAVTGEDGRFAIPGFGKDKKYRLVATSLEGQPYFVTCIVVPDVVGLAPIEADIDCVPGIPFRLRLTDAVTGKPVIATVNYWLIHPNPIARDVPGYYPAQGIGALGYAHREADGTYVGAVLPGAGAILIHANNDLYMPASVDPRPFFGEKVDPEAPGRGPEHYGDSDYLVVANGNSESRMPQAQFSAIVLTNPAADSGPMSFDVALERDTNREVRVVDPAGRPLPGAVVMDRDGTGTRAGPFLLGTFTATGLNPSRVRRLTLRHDERRLAGSLFLRGDDEGGPATVRLEPWGVISGRLVDAEGHPRAKAEMADAQEDRAQGWLWEPIRTDAAGRFRVEALVPGQKYSARLVNVKDGGEYGFVFRDVSLKPGEILDLGDVRPTPAGEKPSP